MDSTFFKFKLIFLEIQIAYFQTLASKMKFLLLFLLMFGSAELVFAQGDLMVYPTRLVFDGKQDRIQIINLNNTGKDSTTYNLSYVENRMLEDGHLEILEIPEAGQKIASPYLRFYPRTITLAPGETQVVKIQLVKTNELEKGEYRSHLYFRPIVRPEELKKREQEVNASEGISISLQPVYGVTIANIVRIDNPMSTSTISDLAMETSADQTFLAMQLNREGDASSYGDISVEYISPKGEKIKVAEKKGVAVYTPGTLRKDLVKLKNIEGVDFTTGKLTVRFTAQGANKTILAEKTLEL